MFDTILDDPREWWGYDLYDPTLDWPALEDSEVWETDLWKP